MTDEDKRQKCMGLVASMPASGLDETLESLAEYVEFYRKRDAYVPPPKPEPKIISAKFAGFVERPPLIIEEDY